MVRRAWARAWTAIALVALAACGGGGSDGEQTSDDPEPAVVQRQLRIDGATRNYRLYTPPDFPSNRPVPLLLALHGSFNSANSLVDATKLDEAASANGFIVAYPEAVGLVWNGGFCCTGGRGASDVRFLDDVITDVASVRRIDTARIYAVGVSAGGVMAYRLGCDLAGRLAGVGSIAGSMLLDDCQPSRPISVIKIHGTADEVVPYPGGRIMGGAIRPAPPAPAVVERWVALNQCPEPASTQTEGLVTTATWSGCANNARVRFITVEGGNHQWYDKDFGLPNGAMSATEAFLQFFELTRRP